MNRTALALMLAITPGFALADVTPEDVWNNIQTSNAALGIAVTGDTARNGDALVVTGLGSPSYDVHASGDRDDNYYLWGAMGGAALTGLGLAQAQPGRRVMVITGDGEMLMAFGALATIGVARPRNLDIIVLDNQHFGETGMQESHTGRGIDIAGSENHMAVRSMFTGFQFPTEKK